MVALFGKRTGGSFASGFLSGALSSGMSSGASALGVGNAGMIGVGGLSGGIGSSIVGGSFWRGVGQGLITSGLNHAAHSGVFGEGLAVSLVTQRVRHIFGPDAYYLSVGGEAGVAPLVSAEAGQLWVRRGPNQRTMPLWDYGVGGGLDMGVNAELTRLYYSGRTSNIKASTFTGYRTKVAASITIGGLDVGQSASYSRIPKTNNFVIGIGNSFGVGLGIGPTPVTGVSGNVTYGKTFFPKF